jgi:hypothetical protein
MKNVIRKHLACVCDVGETNVCGVGETNVCGVGETNGTSISRMKSEVRHQSLLKKNRYGFLVVD